MKSIRFATHFGKQTEIERERMIEFSVNGFFIRAYRFITSIASHSFIYFGNFNTLHKEDIITVTEFIFIAGNITVIHSHKTIESCSIGKEVRNCVSNKLI